MLARIEIGYRSELIDPQGQAFLKRLQLACPDIHQKVDWARVIDLYWVDIPAPAERMKTAVQEIFWDPVLNYLSTGGVLPSCEGATGNYEDVCPVGKVKQGDAIFGIEKRFRPGVTDNVARTIREAIEIVLPNEVDSAKVRTASGKLLVLQGADLTESDLNQVARDLFCNELIESWGKRNEDELASKDRFHPQQVEVDLPQFDDPGTLRPYEKLSLQGLNQTQLEDLSRDRLWALSGKEMAAVRDFFLSEGEKSRREAMGLPELTDVEMEVIAQTWSEHCKHKIFGAEITYRDDAGNREKIPDVVDGLFKETIRGATEKINKDWLLSVFSDNAGIVALDEKNALCMKVETHNSPSALDPYGGAMTGIVGVNRDILGCGLGARPIFNTDVFCTAVPDYSQDLPDRLLHPHRILSGVRKGVEDGGNQSGIPTINGALVFDDRYLGKPLVYCGTGGIIPREVGGRACETKEIRPGDRICMVGGRIGKDGIHGATFSSLALDENSPVSAVQLGDPITQKRAGDFLLEARDLGLYRCLTDNGAGGLSSSVGEMATLCGGAKMDVAKAKVKYPGLKPFELVVSESQERMTVAVPPESLEEFERLAERRGVEVSVVGDFNDSGYFDITFGEVSVASLDLSFLHDGLPRLKLKARWRGRKKPPETEATSFMENGKQVLTELLGRPGIASKEWLIRQYDHEVQGTSVIKPLHSVKTGDAEGASGPNDAGVVLADLDTRRGVTVSCGIRPSYSDVDPYLMAQAAVDEAIRNALCVGAEYGRPEAVMALIDNFCWPDPVNHNGNAAALVRACYGMREAVLALEIPLISGKDSMKNDYRGKLNGESIQISVPPTLLMTAVAGVEDIAHARSADFKAAGDWIYLIGGKDLGLWGAELESHAKEKGRGTPSIRGRDLRAPKANWSLAKKIYSWLGGSSGDEVRALRSIHDLSEGGLLVALSESLIARGLGASVSLGEGCPWLRAFGEGFHSFIVSLGSEDVSRVESSWLESDIPFQKLGQVNSSGELQLSWEEKGESRHWTESVSQLKRAWNRENYWE